MICIRCKAEVCRVPRAEKNKENKTVFLDSVGRQWKGHTCPTCRTGSGYLAVPKTKRKCRYCAVILPATRFFQCTGCVPYLPPDVIAYVVEFS